MVKLLTYELKNNLQRPVSKGFGEKGKEKRRCSINLREEQWKLLDKTVEENREFSSRNNLLRHIVDFYSSHKNAGAVELIDEILESIEDEEDRAKLLELQADLTMSDKDGL